jgi:hypothetical protein
VTGEFVTIDERIADLATRYPTFRGELEAAREPAHAMEAELAAAARLTASELEACMRAAWAEGSAA